MEIRARRFAIAVAVLALLLAAVPSAGAAVRHGVTPVRASVVAGDMENVVSWTASGRYTGFQLYASSSPNGPFVPVTPRAVRTTRYVDRVRATGRRYYYVAALKGRAVVASSAVEANDRVAISRPVGSGGATLRAANGAVALALPAGALRTTTTVTIDGPVGRTPQATGIRTAPVFDLGPDGTALAVPASLTIRYQVPVTHFQVALVLEQATDLATYDDARAVWTTATASADTSAGTFTGSLRHFSYWTGAVIQPHGTTPAKTSYCSGVCHDLVDAPGSPTVIPSRSKIVCYNCHGNTSALLPPAGATGPNIQAEFLDAVGSSFTATSSRHPVAEGKLYCTACHNPHADPSVSYKNLRVYDAVTGRAIQTNATTSNVGSEYCWACHGAKKNARIETVDPGYWARTGDKKTAMAGTGHDKVAAPTVSGIRCLACHTDHGASNTALIATSVAGQAVSGNDKSLCLACHVSPLGAYRGAADYADNRHATTTTSTKAAGTYPSSASSPGACQNCHDPHGKPGLPNYQRADGATLCPTCHDAAGLSYPSGYGYRGAAVMAASGHGTIAGGGPRTAVRNADSEGFAAWESTTLPTPSAPGAPITGSRLDGLRAVDASLAVTKLAVATGAMDYQTYRFKTNVAAADVRSVTAKWRGFGEELAGYPVTLYLWDRTANAGAGGWQEVLSQQVGSKTTLATSTVDYARYTGPDGYLYMLARAVNVRDADITSGPSVTGATAYAMRVRWDTLGLTSGYVDVGTTTGYGSTYGSATRTQAHDVLVTLPGPDVYHYRIRGTSQDGDAYVSGDYVLGVPAPVLTDIYGFDAATADVGFQWSDPAPARDPFTYRLRVWSDLGYSYDATLTSTATTLTLGVGNYAWQVEAVDAYGISFGWSNADSFYIQVPSSGSCPFLFTFDGTGYRFEADVMMPGKLANKVATGYQKPNPQDAYRLRTPPAAVDGAWSFKLVEERQEVDYIDRLQLFAADAPAGCDVYAEKPGVGGTVKEVAAQLHTVRDPRAPLSAVHVETGTDVAAKLAADDGDQVVLNEDREDFTYQTLELDLGDAAMTAPQVKLLIDGSSAFFETAEGLANSATYGPRTKVAVQQADGTWYDVPQTELFMPVPPEFARTYVFDITKALAHGGPKVRLTFLYKTYLDMIAVDTSADETVTLSEAPLRRADLSYHGIDARSSEDPDIYEYVYGIPVTRFDLFPGLYTKYGDVVPLLASQDDEFVIAGSGDALDLAFEALPAAPAGVSRTLVLGTYGFYKDRKNDLPHTVEPLPFSAMSTYPYPDTESYPTDAEHAAYRAEWNTRPAPAASPAAASAPAPAAFLRSLRDALAALRGLIVRALAPAAPAAAAPVHRSLNTDYVGLEFELAPGGLNGQCPICHAVHGATDWDGTKLPALRASADGLTCTANGSGACHSSPATAAAGLDIYAKVTEYADPTAHHDVLPSQQAQSGSRVACGDCHNPHSDDATSTWSEIDSKSTKGKSGVAKYFDASGSMYVMAAARHDGRPPVITGETADASSLGPLSLVVRWTTDEAATTWVDYGTTVAYELGSVGSAELTTTHAATIGGLAFGSGYYYRVRTADALGNVAYGAQQYYEPMTPPAAPVMSPIETITINGALTGPGSVTASWSPVASTDGGGVEYRMIVDGYVDSGWIPAVSWTSPAALYGGYYTAQVMARDALHPLATSVWSAVTFYVNDVNPPITSCPDLFTWDGGGFAFVSDVMNNAPIGVRLGTGYLYPRPYEETRIDPSLLVPKDGRYELRLRDNNDEIEYVDRVALKVVDHPRGTQVFLDDMRYASTVPTHPVEHIYTVREPKPIAAASYDNIVLWKGTAVTGRDITSELASADRVYAPASIYDDNRYTFDLGDMSSAERIKLLVTGWTEYPAHDVAAARQAAGGAWARQVLEVQAADGSWVTVSDPTGYIPGYTKTIVYDLTGKFPADVTRWRVRIRGLIQTHLDQVLVDTSADEPVTVREVAPVSAGLSYVGVSKMTRVPKPDIGYADLRDGWVRLNEGLFTRYGDVLPLTGVTDDEFVVMDTGDELALSFPVPAQADGTDRTCLIAADGYFQQVTHAVDPKPFHAMSTFPYPAEEHYPTDEQHAVYLSTYNTRLHTGQVVPVREAGSVTSVSTTARDALRVTKPMPWARLTLDAIAARVVSWPVRMLAALRTDLTPLTLGGLTPLSEPEVHHSLNTDALRVRVTGLTGSVATFTASAGWESVGTTSAVPSPALPGTALSGERLSGAASVDASYCVTGLTTTDSEWNRQVYRFDVTASVDRTANEVFVAWTGHGEPTPGYSVVPLYVWNFETSTWDKLAEGSAVGDVTLAAPATAIPSSYCLACHDGAPPTGVVFPAGVKNIAAMWGTTPANADRHGAFAGTGSWGYYGLHTSITGLAPGFARGSGALPCTMCHDPHGNGNRYHLQTTVNGHEGLQIRESGSVAFCKSCHTGTVRQMHESCAIDCHYGEPNHYDDITYLLPNESSDCLSCHRHGQGWGHVPDCHGDCSSYVGYPQSF